MNDVNRPAGNPRRRTAVAGFVSCLLVLLAALTLVVVPSASATQAAGQGKGKGPCPTDPYTGATDHPCPHNGANNGASTNGSTNSSSSGQTSSAQPTLTTSYLDGVIKWKSCGWPAAATGSSVQLYVAGVRMTGPGSSQRVLSSGCTADPNVPICLSTTTYPAVAVDQPFGQAVGSVVVTRSGCVDPVTLGAASVGSGGGTLAFTGANIVLMLAAAAVIIVIGYAIVRLNRQRRRVT